MKYLGKYGTPSFELKAGEIYIILGNYGKQKYLGIGRYDHYDVFYEYLGIGTNLVSDHPYIWERYDNYNVCLSKRDDIFLLTEEEAAVILMKEIS